MGFSRTKDRVFAGYETLSGWLSRRPRPVRMAVYKTFGAVFWAAYGLPGNSVRPTLKALAGRAGEGSPTALFRRYVRHFLTGTDMAERVRHGFGAELDGRLTIPDKARLDGLLQERGVFLALPHLHASFAMVYCLSHQYPMLAVVSLTRNPARAAAQRALYDQAGCEILDVRSETPQAVARAILGALKSGKIVAGTVDRIQGAPEAAIDRDRDVVRATAFGSPVGFGGWPTRFAAKAGAPIVPAMVEQTEDGVGLILGEASHPNSDLAASTQAWVAELENLVLAHPHEWAFCLDKHWSRVLRAE
ncbi:LpxL/LpxP family acyltransferase [Gymnodinialimonas sp.]